MHRRQNQHHVLLDQAERYRYVFVSVCFPLPNRQNQFRSVYSCLWFNCECDWWCVCVWLWILAFLSMYTCESLHVHYFQLWMHCTKNYTNWRRCPNEESVLISEIMCVCLQTNVKVIARAVYFREANCTKNKQVNNINEWYGVYLCTKP